jgi:hypothetical protein
VTVPSSTQVVAGLELPRGPYERPELERVAAAFAARTELWKPHLDLDADTRSYAELFRDADMDVWALFWVPGGDTGWHDHDVSSGAVRVVAGELTEHALMLGGPDLRRHYGAGRTFSFGPSHIHRLTCEVPTAVSIHAYSPPLWRLGQYGVSDDGVLHRQSVSYADELRPVAA